MINSHTCERCADLEEQVAWLKSELAIQRDDNRFMQMRRAWGIKPSEAKLLSLLHAAKGNVVSHARLFEAMPPRDYALEDDRNPDCVKVRIHMLRKALGRDAIENLMGRGYALTETGIARVDEALGGL